MLTTFQNETKQDEPLTPKAQPQADEIMKQPLIQHDDSRDTRDRDLDSDRDDIVMHMQQHQHHSSRTNIESLAPQQDCVGEYSTVVATASATDAVAPAATNGKNEMDGVEKSGEDTPQQKLPQVPVSILITMPVYTRMSYVQLWSSSPRSMTAIPASPSMSTLQILESAISIIECPDDCLYFDHRGGLYNHHRHP
jgi:hypothetical protein